MKTRLVWCSVARATSILKVDIPLSDNPDDITKAIVKVMKVRSGLVRKIWKVSSSLTYID